jgi:hypothetical protein
MSKNTKIGEDEEKNKLGEERDEEENLVAFEKNNKWVFSYAPNIRPKIELL